MSYSRAIPMGHPRAKHGLTVGYHKEHMGCPWDADDLDTYPWDGPPVGNLLATHGPSMGSSHGLSMR